MDKTSLYTKSKAVIITVKGRVQGVGYRPFVFQIATQFAVTGTVQNNMDGVRIFAEGQEPALQFFVDAIHSKAPRLARIDEVIIEDSQSKGHDQFSIIPSERTGKSSLVIPVDSAICVDCLQEMREPNDFRYRYPFINCTQCGPRYTIIDSLPYDRPYTSMSDFHMCSDCEKEYEDPMNRRHHAQPIACDSCGPKVMIVSMGGDIMREKDDAIKKTIELLSKGKIVAVKGIGGYHLACDAFNEGTVAALRERKHRPQRPLAMMVANIEVAKEICHVSPQEEMVLQSSESPIVILKKRGGTSLANSLAPGMNTLGVMLPYTPLHHLLFEGGSISVLVMTSANPSGLPMLYKDEEAVAYLQGIADYILTNNRPILHPVDDSVVRIIDGKQSFLRRSRCYVPDPFTTSHDVHEVVALGPQQKNNFAIGRNKQIFVGPHIGEMEHLEVLAHYEKELSHLMKWMGIEGKMLATDMHPGYVTTELARSMKGQIIPVQHHHAHLVSCMEDNKLIDSVFGIILDGTGYGEDGHIWGFEILYGDPKEYRRLAHLHYTHLPGNEKAIKEPWRNATAMLIDYFGDEGCDLAKRLFIGRDYEIEIMANMLCKGVNSPLAGTCGRLFDAVSAILGVCEVSTYDGEAAIKLSELLTFEQVEKPYSYKVIFTKDIATINFAQGLKEIIQDKWLGIPLQKIIERFHETVVTICVELIFVLSNNNPSFNKQVVLSGGSFHNPYLAVEISKRIKKKGFQVYTHKRVPCNDGGLSLGQLIIASQRR
ncbi:carbamoyltransferase HypF [Robertmurraya sp. 2P01SA]